MIDRKEFLKLSCTSCLLGAAAMMLPGITGCSPTATNIFKTEIADKKIVVPLQLFETAKLQVVRPKGWLYDIAVQKLDDGNFTALLLQCTIVDRLWWGRRCHIQVYIFITGKGGKTGLSPFFVKPIVSQFCIAPYHAVSKVF